MEEPQTENNIPDFSKIKMNIISHPEDSTLLKSGNDVQYGGTNDDTQLLVPPASEKMTIFSYLKTLTIELALFTFIFGYVMEMSCLPNMMMDKGCLFHFNYSAEICNNLSHYSDEKEKVEILATNYVLYFNLMSLFGALMMIFIAPWSDKYGRKIPLALAFIGIIAGDICILMCVINFESELFYLILARIPNEIFGGIICVMTTVFSHASEVSSEETRTQKYTTVEIAMGLGISLGGLAGGTMYRYYGYFYVYLTETIIHCFSMAWVVFCVQETRGLGITASWGEKVRDLFKFENLKKGWKASVRPRENNGRFLILMFFLSTCFLILTYESFGSIGYTYVHHVFNWDPMTYNTVNTLFHLSQMVLLLVFMPILIQRFSVSDYALGILGTISIMGKFFLIAFAHYGAYLFYLGNALGSFSGVASLAVRSGISKIVDKDELGKIFSFLATCESTLPMIGTVVITKVFNATINITPSISYLMTVVILLMPLGTFIWAYRLSLKPQALEKKASIE